MKTLSTLFCSVLITACAHHPTSISQGKPMPERAERSSATQFMKTDFDRMADVELAENTLSLKTLMLKLYKRNPQELAKSTSDPAEKMVTWVFEGELQHHWQFADMQSKQGTEAIHLSFHPDYQGDRVLAFIVGIQTMLQKAHSDKKEFFLTDSIDPQSVYNVARNVEIAAWKLSSSRKPNGELYLLSNELNAQVRNLTFEREFGKIIGRTDLFAFMLAEKSERLISRITQNIATMAFLPF